MIDLNKIAKKWQNKWEKAKIFKVKEYQKKKKYYCLEMYPYPSGSGLHMGHARNYCIGDVHARYKRMNGFNVLYPMGYDSFGLPAENAAIKAKSHPKIFTEDAIKSFIKQQKALGLSYDWDRVIASHSPEYYKWDQWIFLKMYEKGLVYKKNSQVNWCPECKTVLANEQVHNGKCWRHTETDVETKELSQWFFRITDYAEELFRDIGKLTGWSEDVKIMQSNWIGKSEGVNIIFKLKDSNETIETFTTRHDTMYGMSFIVIAPEHPKVKEWVKGTKYEKPTIEFINKVKKLSIIERTSVEKRAKRGLFIGRYAIHPFTGKDIPIYLADFVLADFGTGIVQAVPAHDQRDFDFAKEYNLPIIVTVQPDDYKINATNMTKAYEGYGTLVNSGKFSGMRSEDALETIADKLEEMGAGKRVCVYRLKDWLISRQRFWGCPIPIVYCDKCGIVPVPERDLPVRLPEDYKFTIGKGNPLEHCKKFVNTKCPKCGKNAKRETDTMDTFVDSSWYFLRYCDPKNNNMPFEPKKAAYWMPIDMYIGGKEHAIMHLIYFRFFTKFLRDIKLLKIDEPTLNLFNQGMLHKGGVVMSKSKGNVVTQEEIEEKYGIDTGRLFLLFVASPDKDMEWDDKGVEGAHRFLKKLCTLVTEKRIINKLLKNQESKLNRTIKEVTEHIDGFKYNLALISLMGFTNYLSSQEEISRKALEGLLVLLAPFTPHVCEELWEFIGNKPFISLQKWPEWDESKIDAKVEAQEELIERVVSDVRSVLTLIKVEEPKAITLIVADGWKYRVIKKIKEKMDETRNSGEIIKAVIDKEHGKEIAELVQRVLKNPSLLPSEVLDQETELNGLESARDALKKRFNCNVNIIRAEKSKEQKAKQALPGKPAILVEK